MDLNLLTTGGPSRPRPTAQPPRRGSAFAPSLASDGSDGTTGRGVASSSDSTLSSQPQLVPMRVAPAPAEEVSALHRAVARAEVAKSAAEAQLQSATSTANASFNARLRQALDECEQRHRLQRRADAEQQQRAATQCTLLCCAVLCSVPLCVCMCVSRMLGAGVERDQVGLR
jgi:hypothetical protein